MIIYFDIQLTCVKRPVYVAWLIQQKDDAVKLALKRELEVMSAENRLKRVSDEDGDELPLLYPFDADEVSLMASYLLFLFSLLYHLRK